jgi:hypothetical protein
MVDGHEMDANKHPFIFPGSAVKPATDLGHRIL